MNDVKPLWFLGNPSKEQADLIHRAKLELDPGFFVQPTRYDDSEEGGLALAFEWPAHPVLHGFLYVEKVRTLAQMKNVLRALWFGEFPAKIVTPEKWFGRTMGIRVTEVEEEDDEASRDVRVGR